MTDPAPRWTRREHPATLTVPVLGRIEGCTHPESAELLPDDEHFVFGNCAMTVGVPAYREGKGLVYLEGEAFISLARIAGDRSVSLVKREVTGGLTGTLGCDVLRRATARFPEGTVFMAAGGNPAIRRGEAALAPESPERRSQVLAFDPFSGERLGTIPLWQGSALGRKYNRLDQPNGLAINAAGDLFVGDIPNGNPVSVLPAPTPSAVYRIPHAALDPLAAGEDAAEAVQRVLAPGFVNGLTVSVVDGHCWMVSCSTHDPDQGGLYRLTETEFAAGELPEASVKGIGVIDGVGFTRRGSVVLTNPRTATVHLFLPDGDHRLLEADDGVPLGRNPADINICYPTCLDGEPALLVPDVCVGRDDERSTVSVLDLTGF